MHTSNTVTEDVKFFKKINWSSISSGMLTSTVVSLLLALLGSGIGLSLFDPNLEVIKTLNISAVIWVVLTGIVAMFIGGIVTGYLCAPKKKGSVVIHSFVMWSITFLLGLVITIGGAGSLLSGSGQLVSQTINVNKEATNIIQPLTKKALEQIDFSDNAIVNGVKEQLQQLENQMPEKSKKETLTKIVKKSASDDDSLFESVKAYLTNNKDQLNKKLEKKALQALTNNTNLTQKQAKKVLENWKDKYDDFIKESKEQINKLKEQAKATLKQTSNMLGATSLAAFIAMILGLIATVLGAFWGSFLGSKRN